MKVSWEFIFIRAGNGEKVAAASARPLPQRKTKEADGAAEGDQ